ncbi:sensor histidine kinase [Desulfatiglans anilini]|uniref:sensor histidine kinase n=1 Tax=Desulfatiglans anilini TaxID=90728 RepID=UPI0004134B85|nr:histidine kinase N-terminal 7TM domain-containing protein [Desulfatiglans anilini]
MIGTYSYRPDIWPAVTTLVLVVYLGVYSWRRREIPAARPFTVACFLGALWAFGTILELSAVDFSSKVFWVKFQAVWQLPVAATIICFVLQYAGLGRWLTRRNYILLFLFPLLCVLMMVTNNLHHLIWTEFRLNGYVTVSPGEVFWIFVSYGILIVLFNVAVLVWLAIRSPGHRWPVAIMLAGQMIGRLAYTLDKLDSSSLIGPGESVFFVVGVASVAYALAFLRFHAIDPVAAARNAVLHQMDEGLFVLDLDGRIVDVNPMAAAILGTPERTLRGKPLTEVMPVDPGFLKQPENEEGGSTEIIVGKDASARHYHLNLTNLKGRQGEVIGQLLLLRDVTGQKRAQANLLDQQRVVATLQERDHLARELHDGIGQILGYVSMQVQTARKWLRDGNQEKAESLLGRIAEVSKDAHAEVRESILSLRIGPDQNWSLIPALKKYIDRFQANYGIRTELSISDRMGDTTFLPAAEVQVFRVIQEAMTNCRKHSGAHSLKVDIALAGSRALVTISDDGQGFDAGQFEQGQSGHFGLGFMRERMEQIGGSLTIDSIPGSGTMLKLDVPIRKQPEDSL